MNMPHAAQLLKNLIPITQFNKGKATSLFDRLKTERQLIVLKNNAPTAVIISPQEYARLSEIEENYQLLVIAESRLPGLADAVPAERAYELLGLTAEDIAVAEDVDIE